MLKLSALIVTITSAIGAFGQVRPDLVVSALTANPDPSGQFIVKVTVTVSNVCRGSESETSFVMVTFRENAQPGSKQIYFIGSRIKALKGGTSQTVVFDVAASGKDIELGRHVFAEVDPYRTTAEASESNNWRTINPNAAGDPQCR